QLGDLAQVGIVIEELGVDFRLLAKALPRLMRVFLLPVEKKAQVIEYDLAIQGHFGFHVNGCFRRRKEDGGSWLRDSPRRRRPDDGTSNPIDRRNRTPHRKRLMRGDGRGTPCP